MNQFRTTSFFRLGILVLLGCFIFPNSLSASQLQGDSTNVPYFTDGEYLYADIDSEGQRVFIVVDDWIWKYDLQDDSWEKLLSLRDLDEPVSEFEFGYNQYTGNVNFWSRGVGKMYKADLESKQIRRVDQSFNHRNQFLHTAFYRDSTLYAFGGYGYWRWENIITFYHPELQEWVLQNVDVDSKKPSGRVPHAGIYDKEKDALYIYGGRTPVNEHQDDQNAKITLKYDIWMFSFRDKEWENIMTVDAGGWQFYTPHETRKFLRTNSLSLSAYSSDSKMWYLPFTDPGLQYNNFLVKPINVDANTEYPVLEIIEDGYAETIPAAFLFDNKNSNLVVVGPQNISKADTVPINIVKIPEQQLLSRLPEREQWVSRIMYYLFGGILFLAIIAYFYRREYADTESYPEDGIPVSVSRLISMSLFNEQEKKLLQYLIEQDQFLETHKIEENLWGEIDNYDYRRRLRNDIIKSINDKFRNHFDTEERLITRQKDSEDKRRYLYGINKSVVSYE